MACLTVWVLLMCAVHLAQGTASIDFADLLTLARGGDSSTAASVVLESRVPRLLAALLAGGALGLAGAAFQSVTRNPLASPETVGVGAGAYLGLTVASVLGITLTPVAGLAVAFLAGGSAATAVLALSAPGKHTGPLRLVLAGSALTMGLSSVTSVLLLLNPWQTQGMFSWGAGTLAQNGLTGVGSMLPVAAVAGGGLIVMAGRLDLLQLGDDAAASLGIRVGATRRTAVILAVVLVATAVTVTGPIGFVGLCAPAIVRLLSRQVRSLRRQRAFLLASTLTGFGLILTADVALRGVFGAVKGVNVPVGVLTSLIGALLLVILTRHLSRHDADGDSIATMHAGWLRSPRSVSLVIVGAVLLLAGLILAGLLLGDKTLLLGDLGYWVQGIAEPRVDFIFSTRIPRVVAAVLAGAALAAAGLLVQGITRNPLADPGLLGVSATAGTGAVAVITLLPSPGDAAVFTAALVGAVLAAAVLFVLGRGDRHRLVIVGIAVGAAASAVTTLFLIRSDPWDQTRAMTWLGGSTYATTTEHLLPLAVVITAAIVVLVRTHRDLDLLQLDDTTPQVLGVHVTRSRLLHIAVAVALTAAATAAVGVFAFVGLIAPHAARALVGKHHRTVVPLTLLFGAAIVVVADTVGRIVIAPAQLPAGLVVAVVGAPAFLWLLHRSQPRP